MKIKIISATIVFTAALIYGVFFLLYPSINQYIKLNKDINRQKISLNSKESNYLQYSENEALLKKHQLDYSSMRAFLPSLNDITNVIVNINNLLEQHNLTEREFLISKTTKLDDSDIFKTTITITATGSYENMINYLTAIISSKNIATLDNVIMSSENVKTKGDVDFVFKVTLYAGANDSFAPSPPIDERDINYEKNPFYYED